MEKEINRADETNSNGDENKCGFLTFSLSSDTYGIPVNSVREVNRYGNVFPVPKSPRCIKGIINLRGDVIPVIDLNMRLFGVESIISPMTNILIVETEQQNKLTQTGVIIDSVKEVIEINDANIEKTQDSGYKLRRDFVKGIGKEHNTVVLLLDLASILNVDEISGLMPAAAGKDDATACAVN